MSHRPAFKSVILLLFATTLFLSTFSSNVDAQSPNQSSATSSEANNDLSSLVHDIIRHEMEEQAHDDSLWCFRKSKEEEGKHQLFHACQAKGAEIDRLMSVNGKELTEKEKKSEDDRIEKLTQQPEAIKKRAREQHEDAKRAEEMLKLIPDAFLFQKESQEADRIRLKFSPNPAFHPSGHEAQVFYHMSGTLILDLRQKRLAEINGRLTSKVKFGGGLLGHLDEGGTFHVKQENVGQSYWEMTTLDVHMTGKALFFKTIGVQQKEIYSEFRSVPPNATIQQAAEMTKNKIAEVAQKK